MKRKIFVPGRPLTAAVVISDVMQRVVLAVPHNGEVVVIFVGDEPTARAMTIDEAEQFRKDLKELHQAAADDVKIAEMERNFFKEAKEPDEPDE